LSSLTRSDTLLSCQEFIQSTQEQKRSFSTEFGSIVVRSRGISIFVDTFGRTRRTRLPELARCIEKFGRHTTGQFRKVVTFITKTAIHSTTTFQTWNALLHPNTAGCTITAGTSPNIDTRLCLITRALIAESLTRLFGRRKPSIVAKRAKKRTGGSTRFITKLANASSVAQNSWPTNTRQRNRAQQNAEAVYCPEIGSLPDRQPVFNLSVGGCPEYFANGILVHNCIADAIANRMIEERLKPSVGKKVDEVPVNCAATRREQRLRRHSEERQYEWD